MASTTTTTTSKVEVDAQIVSATMELTKVREMMRELEKQEKALREQLLAVAGDADQVLFGGIPLFDIERSTRRSPDLKVLAEKFPQAYAETLRETPVTKIKVL